MKLTRREFLFQAAATAIAIAADWAITGARVEDAPEPEPVDLEYADFGTGWIHSNPGQGSVSVYDAEGCCVFSADLDERAVMTFEDGCIVWHVPVDARTIVGGG